MTSASVWLLSLVLCWGLPSPHTTLSSAAVYYVTPYTPNTHCPSGKPCLTINEYAQGNHFDGDDNITLFFMKGEHNLIAQNLVIGNKTSLKLTSAAALYQCQVYILLHVDYKTSIALQNIAKVEISELCFSNLKSFDIETMQCFSISDTKLLSVSQVLIDNCNLSLQEELETISINGFSARSDSHVFVVVSHNSLNIAISESRFYKSSISFRDKDITLGFSTAVSLHSFITNCFITGYDKAEGSGHVELTFNQCNITQYDHSPAFVSIIANGDSLLEVNFDQCFMENWCYDHDDCDVAIVGINVTSLDNAAIITTITATTLGGCAIEVQWNLSIPDTLGTTKSVQYKEVSLFQRLIYTHL